MTSATFPSSISPCNLSQLQPAKSMQKFHEIQHQQQNQLNQHHAKLELFSLHYLEYYLQYISSHCNGLRPVPESNFLLTISNALLLNCNESALSSKSFACSQSTIAGAFSQHDVCVPSPP